MSDTADDYFNEFDTLVAQIEKLIESNGKLNLNKIKEKRNRIDIIIKSISIELRELPTGLRTGYNIKLSDYKNILIDIDEDIKALDDVELIQHNINNINNMTTIEILGHAEEIQKKSLNSLANSKNIVDTTIDIGTTTLKDLEGQGKQLNRINNGVEVVDNNINRATRILRSIMRRMATDKLIMTFICLVILGIIALVIVLVLRKYNIIPDGNSGNPSNSTIPTNSTSP
ncbi:MAG: hypothetical protein Terrestrivirus2_44 [Terrestrivirus sp.]|uniref:t-SNARE coiled-coil homology domain-containing protein n=1 Tax=Terrestrivirus sp. TaxID=2487775 RepID=A0A3G4ZL28_9VIRU|nr:MAG: hypothetical protein Terrestrivirus2_44 [Terrestrivirus sp.]